MAGVTFACVKYGPLYGPEYVNILLDMIARNLPGEQAFTFACFTDDATGLSPAVDVRPLPKGVTGWWNKLALFSLDAFPVGERVIFFDLDTVIIGRLDAMYDRSTRFAILRDLWGNDNWGSGVMAWEAGSLSFLWENWLSAGMPETPGGDQEWIKAEWDRREKVSPEFLQDMFPKWFCSFKIDCNPYPRRGTKVICFHGQPKPHNCVNDLIRMAWKIGGGKAFDLDSHCNTENEIIEHNIKNAASLPHEWVYSVPETSRAACIVGGGPSIHQTWPSIAQAKREGAVIYACNQAATFLHERGITPDWQIIIDAREHNSRFVGKGHAKGYLLASQCHPDVFLRANDATAIIFQCLTDEAMDQAPKDRNVSFIGGGSTVLLRALPLIYAMGHRQIHMYGADSSIVGVDHHAYPQPENDADEIGEVWCGEKMFRTTTWLAAQANQFQHTASDLAELGCSIHVHGDGLLPEVARLMSQPNNQAA